MGGVDQNSIHAWLFPAPSGKPLATIVQFHGNAENISSHYTSLLWLRKQGFELFTFDYRGYGRSEGKPDTGKIIADSKLVLKFLQNRNKKKNIPIILYGQSLGGVLAARTLGELENRSLISSIVIEASFSSYRSIGKEVGRKICLPLGYLAHILISDHHAVDHMLPKLSPIHAIVVHGSADTVVPYSYGQNIFRLLKKPKDFLGIPEGGHLNWHHLKKYERERRLLAKILKSTL